MRSKVEIDVYEPYLGPDEVLRSVNIVGFGERLSNAIKQFYQDTTMGKPAR